MSKATHTEYIWNVQNEVFEKTEFRIKTEKTNFFKSQLENLKSIEKNLALYTETKNEVYISKIWEQARLILVINFLNPSWLNSLISDFSMDKFNFNSDEVKNTRKLNISIHVISNAIVLLQNHIDSIEILRVRG